MKPTLKKMSFYLEESQIEKLQTWSEKTLIPTSALVRRAIDESLEMHKAEIRGHEMTTKTSQDLRTRKPKIKRG